MNIREFQLKIAAALNGIEALVQGCCKAFAEDAMGIGFEIAECLNVAGIPDAPAAAPQQVLNKGTVPAASSPRGVVNAPPLKMGSSRPTASTKSFPLALERLQRFAISELHCQP